MFAELADVLVWIVRATLFAGICWGGWLCVAPSVAPGKTRQSLRLQHYATFALLVLIVSAIGGVFGQAAG